MGSRNIPRNRPLMCHTFRQGAPTPNIIFGFSTLSGSSKVMAFLQYAKAVRSTDKIPLYVNMDETSVSFSYAKGKGLIMSKKSLPPGMKHRRTQVCSGDEKSHISLLAFITHNKDVQPLLPQIFLGNEHIFTLGLLQQLAPPHSRAFQIRQGEVRLEQYSLHEDCSMPPGEICGGLHGHASSHPSIRRCKMSLSLVHQCLGHSERHTPSICSSQVYFSTPAL